MPTQNNRRRVCARCGARLASDNAGEVCRPCEDTAYSDAVAPVLPDEFWERGPLKAALAARDFGRVVRAYRREHDPVLPQEVVGGWFGLSQGQISRIEHAVEPVHDLSKLERWARALRVPEQSLWFRLPSEARSSSASAVTVHGDVEGERSDVRRRDFVVGTAAYGAALVGRGDVERFRAAQPGRMVGVADVEVIREMTQTFRRLDNRFGGGRVYGLVTGHLSGEVIPLLRTARARRAVERELFEVAAELTQLAGWIAHDVGDQRRARGYLRESLKLAEAGDAHAFGVEVLAGMSHQAAYLGDGTAAVDFAEAARRNARRCDSPRALVAETWAMQAHGLALQSEARACASAMQKAERAFDAAGIGDRPDWLGYFDRAYLAAKFAHAYRALGQLTEAERCAARSLEMSEGYERGRLFNTALLASVHAELGNLDAACDLGEQAVDMARSIESARMRSYLAALRRRLEPHDNVPVVRAMAERLRAIGVTGASV
jgi:tetratricopeptide (TPR) repeat protein/transcriptional regulator with XRE-family HTH domain